MYVYKRGSRIGQANWEREHQQLALSMGIDEKVEFPSKNDLRSGESMMPDKDTRILTLEKQDQNRIMILHLGFFNNSENPTSIGEKSHGWNPSSSIYVRTRDSKSARLRHKVCLWSRQMPLILARLVRLCFQQAIKSKKSTGGSNSYFNSKKEEIDCITNIYLIRSNRLDIN